MSFFDIDNYITELEELEDAKDMHESLTAAQPFYVEGDEYV